MITLALAFLATAALYAAVGFGGGSTYNALLVLNEVDYRAIPTLALLCNILVVSVGSWRFHRDGHVPWRRIWPLFAASVPLAWLGGRLVVPEVLFVSLLAAALLAAGLTMVFQRRAAAEEAVPRRATWIEPTVGGGLGLLSGVVGIGGGIFLAPVLHLIRWGNAKAIAGTCSVFILVNSVAGLAGQLGKYDGYDRTAALEAHWLLFPAVAIGGLIGATAGSLKLRMEHVRIATAVLVLYVAARLGLRSYDLVSGAA